jgi:hypothetical protein
MRARLIRAALSLYPADIRQRYGDELADLLTQSPTPGRDLADVTWCALTERRETLTMSGARVRAGALTLFKVLIAPFAFGMLLLTLMLVTGQILNLAHGAGFIPDEPYELPGIGGMQWLDPIFFAATVVPAALIVAWLGRRLGRTDQITAPAVVVPVALTLGFAAVAGLPGVGQALGETMPAAMAAATVWGVTIIALIVVVAALREDGRRALANLTAIVGAFIVLQLSCITYVVTAISADRAPRQHALWWYLSMISGIDPGLVDGANQQLADAMKGGPAVLTLCTVFALAVTAVTVKQRQLVAESA